MKAHNLSLKALVLVLTIVFTGQSFANSNFDSAEKKKVVKVNIKAPLLKLISNTMEFSPEDLALIKEQLNEANFLLVSHDIEDLEISMVEANPSESVFIIEYNPEVPMIEDWMFEEDYLHTEARPEIENWMMEDNYFESEAAPEIEDWMFEDDYLNTEAVPVIEGWMLDEDYLNTESAPEIESWMVDDYYYTKSECCQKIESWMFEPLFSE